MPNRFPNPPRFQTGLAKAVLVSIISAGLLVVAVAIVLVMRMGDGEDTTAVEEPAIAPLQYLALEPSFIVNLADPGGTHYMQADVELGTRDAALLEQLRAHQPLIRNRLLLLFGDQRLADLRTRHDRERLQQQALEEVRGVLADAGVEGELAAVYFTSFVTQ